MNNKEIITKLERAAKWFENKFPNHDFNWKKGSIRFVGLCPFHADTNPSFNIFIGENEQVFYKCFACGEVGVIEGKEQKNKKKNTFLVKSLVLEDIVNTAVEKALTDSQALEIFDFKIANERSFNKLKEVIKQYKVGVVTLNWLNEIPLPQEESSKKYFSEIKEEIRKRVLSLAVENLPLFLFPYYDMAGHIIGVKVRNLCESSRSSRMYQITKTPSFFGNKYFLETTKSNTGFVYPVFITEGETDSLSINYFSDLPAVATGSTSNFKNILKAEFSLYNFFPVIFPDNDKMTVESIGAGKEAIILLEEERKRKKIKEKVYVYVGNYEGQKDINDYLKVAKSFSQINKNEIVELTKAKEEFELQWKRFKLYKFKKIAGRLELELPVLSEAYKDYLEIIDIVETGVFTVGELFATDFYEEHALLGRFPEGHISLISSFGGSGKTTFALITAIRIVTREHRKVFFWTTEHQPSSLKKKLSYIMKLPEFSEECDYGTSLKDNEEFWKSLVLKLSRPEPFLNEKKALNKKAFMYFEEILKKYDVVILDPILSFIGATENENPEIRKVFDRIHELMRKYPGRTVILLHHFNKLSLSQGVIEDSKIEDRIEEEFFRIKINDLTLIDNLKASVRGAGAYTDAARYVEAIIKTQQGKRIVVTIKTNEECTRREGEGEIIPELEFSRETESFSF